MTEQQARTKWCPMSNIQGYGNRPFPSDSTDDNKCIASDCMMWRWNTKIKIGYKYEGGYCGLGSKP